jgi:hypothetical protein
MPWTEGYACSGIALEKMDPQEGLNLMEGLAVGYGADAIPRLRSVLERLEKEHGAATSPAEA